MKILLLGKNGQVGWELQRSLFPLGELIALGSRDGGDLCGDLTRLDDLAATVRSVRPDVIVNAGAHTAVDKAESESELAARINTEAPGVLAREAKEIGALLVHYSTDYVFDGSGTTPWVETDATGPLSVYGRTKLEGEKAITAAAGAHLIFRTSWVYATRGKNFPLTMLRLAKERDELTVIDDQVGAPTGADLLADATAHAIRATLQAPSHSGIYHLAPTGHTSWHGYASHVIGLARQRGLSIVTKTNKPVPSTAFPTPATRPKNSRLNTDKFKTAFAFNLPPWQRGVERFLEALPT